MNRILCLISIVAGLWLSTAAQGLSDNAAAPKKEKYRGDHKYIYRLTLRDKDGTAFSLSRPRDFLSAKAIERRRRQNLPIDSTDLPVSSRYVKALSGLGLRVAGTSKWHNTVLVATDDTAATRRVDTLAWVVGCKMVWQAPDSVASHVRHTEIHDTFRSWDTLRTERYGNAEENIRHCGGHTLHDAGFRGRGMTIAVLDGGFMNTDRIPALTAIDVLGLRDFVYPRSPKHAHGIDHGTKVLSVMGTDVPNVYVGTAPEASYWLLRCEDPLTEQPVEEDYWTMAAEFADSVGVDVINSSLGYSTFDGHLGDYAYRDMDGRTAFISRSASMLAGKGIVLVNSAGNSGMGAWKKIGFPADAYDILTVGAVTPTLDNAPFSSVGPTQDGRIKPDVMAPGSPTGVISGRGTIVRSMGTSFAAPVICGLVACLWQARPHLTAREIITIVRRAGDRADCPDTVFGYGLPDFGKAMDDITY
mgnify:CR=1 FL=1